MQSGRHVAFEASTYCTCFTGGMQPHAHVPTRRRNANEPGRHAVEDLELLYEASSPRSQVYVRTFCFKAGQLASRRRNMSQQLTSADGGTVAPSNAAILGDDDHGFARTADDYILGELSSEPVLEEMDGLEGKSSTPAAYCLLHERRTLQCALPPSNICPAPSPTGEFTPRLRRVLASRVLANLNTPLVYLHPRLLFPPVRRPRPQSDRRFREKLPA
jgi:hypothetical protein